MLTMLKDTLNIFLALFNDSKRIEILKLKYIFGLFNLVFFSFFFL